MVTKYRQGAITAYTSILPLLFLSIALYFPIFSLVTSGGLFTVRGLPWQDLLPVIERSFLQAGVSVICSGALGVFFAFIYADSGFRVAKVIWNLSLICFALPTLIVCLALISVWGRSGWFGPLLNSCGIDFYGLFGIVLAHTFMNYTVFFRSVSERLMGEDRQLEKAASSLGATRFQVFRFVTLPKIAPQLYTSAVLVFTYCFGSFLAVLLLGGGPRFTTIEVLIYQAIRLDQDLSTAAVLSFIQLAFCGSILFIMKRPTSLAAGGNYRHFPVFCPRRSVSRVFLFSATWSALLFLLSPLLLLCWDGIPALARIADLELLRVTVRSIVLSLTVGISATAIGTATAYTVVRTRHVILRDVLQISTTLPLVLSGIVLSLMIFNAYSESGLLNQTLVGPFLIQLLIALPLVVRYVVRGFESVPPALLLSAASLGASDLQKLIWIELPLIKGSVRVAFALAVCLSLGEVGSLLMFAVGGEGVLPLWIFRQMGRYHFQEAAAGGLVLVLVLALFLHLVGDRKN